jgi:hypothetical protein
MKCEHCHKREGSQDKVEIGGRYVSLCFACESEAYELGEIGNGVNAYELLLDKPVPYATKQRAV